MLEIIIAAVIGGIIGWRAAARVHVLGFRELLRALKVTDEDMISAVRKIADPAIQEKLDLIEPQVEQPAAVVEVKLEQMGNELYAYRKSDSQFLGQGTDADTLIERLNQNLTPCRVVIHKEDGAELLTKHS